MHGFNPVQCSLGGFVFFRLIRSCKVDLSSESDLLYLTIGPLRRMTSVTEKL